MPKRWPGSAILGNGNVCAVYSDDPRIVTDTGRRGILHFYYKDYTADYVHSTVFELIDGGNVCARDPARPDSVDFENFHTTFTRSYLADGAEIITRAFAHPRDAVVLVYSLEHARDFYSYRLWVNLPRRIITDRTIRLVDAAKGRGEAWFEWSDGTVLAIGTDSRSGRFSAGDEGVVIEGEMDDDPLIVILAAAESEKNARNILKAIRKERSPWATAVAHWEDWIDGGVVPDFGDEVLLDAYRRNLYAAQSANLGGQIPADLTGQFLTHSMPQLYPRDALMCARAFLFAGHMEETRQVLSFWTAPRIPMKSPGEWYARYSAHGEAVDGGSGTRYNEPEWDSSAYVIQLAEACFERTGEWAIDPAFLLTLADFLVEHIDERGLLFEGGIVEWTGYLPATNMVAAAALETAARVARGLREYERSDRYRAASQRITSSLGLMFDAVKGTYADVRFEGQGGVPGSASGAGARKQVFLWDTSVNFGVLWGYPNHLEMQQSNAFFAKHCVKLGGGVQYYTAEDEDLARYGHDMSLLTTSAASQYQARFGDLKRAKLHIDWMLENANSYGLMPERIHLDGSGCSTASPLSWCCAEFVATLLEYHETRLRSE